MPCPQPWPETTKVVAETLGRSSASADAGTTSEKTAAARAIRRSMARTRLPDAPDTAGTLYAAFAMKRAGTIRDVEGTTRLRSLLGEAFPDAEALDVVDRTGGGDHFHVTVVSPRFEGLPLLEQHRLVNEALAEPLRDG